jgi:hypothetical protein
LVVYCKRGRRRASRPSDSNVNPLARCEAGVAPLKLGFIVTDSEFEAAKFTRELVVDNIMRCMDSMASMLFAIEAMIAEQIPWLTTRTRKGGCRPCAYGKPKQERLIEGHLKLRESFVWLLEHVHERVRLIFEHNFGGQVKRQVKKKVTQSDSAAFDQLLQRYERAYIRLLSIKKCRSVALNICV